MTYILNFYIFQQNFQEASSSSLGQLLQLYMNMIIVCL